MTLPLKDFYFIRHGETDWNRDHRGMGQLDIPLNETGLRQAHQAAELLKREPIDLIFSSPLERARVTAQIIAEAVKCPVQIIQELKECGWGEAEGKIKGDWVQRWREGEPLPGGELFQEFAERAARGVRQALASEQNVLIVAHGGVFWALQKATGLPMTFDARNAEPFLFRAPPAPGTPWSCISLESDS